jgi:hypothetical protein
MTLNLGVIFDQGLKSSLYLLLKFSRVPLTIVLISEISTMVNGTLRNFGKRYEDNLKVIFDQWPKLHLGLDALTNQKILNGIYYIAPC